LQSEKVIEMVLQAGCQEIWVGVESGSSKILKDLNKGITVSQIKRLDRLFANYDFPWLAFVILGTPTEEEDDLEKTFEMLRQGLFPAIEPFTFHPYTGTELFDELLSLGLINYDQVVRGHQSLGLHFSPKVPRKIFFARLAQIKELARQRKARWQREFYLTEAENQKALAWETNCQNWLKISSKSWLVLGPERRLRWLAALNHYRNLKADLVFIDLDSNTKNQCLFGTINPASFLEKQQERDILLVSSLEEIETWEAKIKALNLKPISLLASAETLGDSGKAFWRPVYQMSRLIKGE
jgi:hypothetical protein